MAFVLFAAGLLWFMLRGDPDVLARSDQTASVGSFFLALAALVVALLALVGTGGGAGADAEVGLPRAVDDLAAAQREQWTAEAGLRRLLSPRPLRLSWSAVADHGPPGVSGALARSGPPAAKLVQTFRGLPSGRLVVVGRPGSGKSVLALLFTLAFLETRTPEDPVPVLLSAAGWDPAEPLRTWLRRRILEDFPFLHDRGRYGADVAKRLVEKNRVLLILDGLDEMGGERSAAALDAVEEALTFDLPIVIACRRAEYDLARLAAGPLSETTVVELADIEPGDAAAFLTGRDVPDDPRWERVVARLAEDQGRELASVLATPLAIWLARTVYRPPEGDHPDDLLAFTSAADIERHLLDRFFAIVYRSEQPGPAPARHGRAQRWLTELARTTTRDMRWWEFARATRPAVLAVLIFVLVGGIALVSALLGPPLGSPYGEAARVAFTIAVPVGLLTGLAAARRLRAPRVGPGLWAVIGQILRDAPLAGASLTVALIVLEDQRYEGHWGYSVYLAEQFSIGTIIGIVVSAVANGLGASARPRRVSLNRATVLGSLGRGLVIGSAVAVPLGVLVGLIALTDEWKPLQGLGWALATAGVITVVVGLPVGVGRWISAPISERASLSPLSTLRADRRALLLTVGVLALPIGAIAALLSAANGNTWLATALITCWTILPVIVVAAIGSGSLWVTYTITRLWRALLGRLPWRPMRFLADAHRRGVLRQAGPAYQFRHDLLQRHLVGPPAPEPPTAAPLERPDQWRQRRTAVATGLAVVLVLASAATSTVPGLRKAIAARAEAEVREREEARAEAYARLGAAADALGTADPDTALRLRIAAFQVEQSGGADSMLEMATLMHARPGAVASVTSSVYATQPGPGGFAGVTYPRAELFHVSGANVRRAVGVPYLEEIIAVVPGRRVVAVAGDGPAKVWNFAQSPPDEAVLGAESDKAGVRVDATGRWALVRGRSGVRLWNIAAWPPRGVPLRLTSETVDLWSNRPGWSPDGRWFSFTEPDGRTVLADLAVIPPRTVTVPGDGRTGQIRFSSNGERALMTDLRTGTAAVWDLTTTPPRQKWLLETGDRLSADGRWAVGKGVVWDLRGAEPVRLPLAEADNPTGFSPDGRWLVVDRHGVTELLRLGRPGAARLVAGPDVLRQSFSDDGHRFAAVLRNHKGVSWNLATDPPRFSSFGPVGDTGNMRLDISGDGRWVLTGAPDGVTDAVWPIDRDATAPVATGNYGVDLSLGADSTLVVSSAWMTVVWDLGVLSRLPLLRPTSGPMQTVACQRVGRGLSKAEWARLLPDVDYEPTCPG